MPLSGPPLEEPVDLFRLLRRGLEAKPNELALVSALTRWTWRELEQTSDNLAQNLLGLGLKPGDRAASLMPNRAALLIYYLACIKAGLVATPLNYRYMPPEMDHALSISDASILFAHSERKADIAASELTGKLPLGLISFDGALGQSPSFEELVKPPARKVTLTPPNLDDPAFIFFTSGSTGKPKGATHSFRSFGWVVASVARSQALTADDILLPGCSLSHAAAPIYSFAGLAAGARVDVARTSDGDELLPLLRETRPTLLLMLPGALIALVRDHDAKPDDFRSLRFCVGTGDKVPAELEKEFTAIAGLPINEGFGMTEFGLSNCNPPSGPNKLGSVGPACAGFEQSIRDDNGEELPPGKEGSLWVKGPADMIGYWGNPKATAETLQDGWLDTGDVMRADDDGYLWFAGRKKQIIVHDSSNISPQEVEEALLAHEGVERRPAWSACTIPCTARTCAPM